MPVGAASFSEALRWGAECYHTLKAVAARAGPVHRHRRRGRLRPQPGVQRGGRRAAGGGHRAGRPHARARRSPSRMDAASTEFFVDGNYVLAGEGRTLSPAEFADYLADLCDRYPIVSIEDGMAEEDWDGWATCTAQAGRHGSSWWATTCSSPTPSAWPGASTTASPTPSWSRSTRSARSPRPSRRCELATRNSYTSVMSHRSGRDRGRHDRGPGGGHQLRPDQDRRPGPLGPGGEVQPAAADRGVARRGRRLPRRRGPRPSGGRLTPWTVRRRLPRIRPGGPARAGGARCWPAWRW